MAAGDPTGPDLVSGTTDGDTLPDWTAGYEEREISFGAGVELTSGVTYAIVIRAPDAAGSPNDSDVVWPIESPGVYGGNYYESTDSGGSWATRIYDTWFKTKAGAIVKDSYLPSNGLTFDDAFGANWLVQTFTASSTYTITSVILKLEAYQFDTTGTITVSIRATIGVPEKPINPTPSDAAADVTLDQATITWEDGGNADTYNIYYGDTSGDLTLVSEGQAGLSFTIQDIALGSPFDYLITRYWRVDAVNDDGTTTGDEWSFISIAFGHIRVSYRLLAGGGGAGHGPYDDPPGTQGIDWEWTGGNAMLTVKRLVVAANSKIWHEDI